MKEQRVEHVKKEAKKGLLSVVFSRTALIVLLLIMQLALIFVTATLLSDYRTYFYAAFTVLSVLVVIYKKNSQ